MHGSEELRFRHHQADEVTAIVQLFASVFAASAGEAEGALIGGLAEKLFTTTDASDLFNLVAVDDGSVVASLFFSRLHVSDESEVFILGPVAVQTDRQGEGIGRALITHGLADLVSRGVQAVLTYGDPKFYGKVGFRQLSPMVIKAPFQLSQPEGWLGQSLVEHAIESLSGQCRCVDALNDPAFW